MNDRILDRIQDAKRPLYEKGIEPTVIYLGQEEWRELKAAVSHMCILRRSDGENRIMGMDTFIIDMPSHLRVY